MYEYLRNMHIICKVFFVASRNGFPVSADLIESLPIVSNADYNERLRNWSSSLKEGEIITMTNLASLLSAISNSTDGI